MLFATSWHYLEHMCANVWCVHMSRNEWKSEEEFQETVPPCEAQGLKLGPWAWGQVTLQLSLAVILY